MSARAPLNPHCPRVLIADHHVETLAVLRRVFERRGCEVFRCVCHHELQGMLSAFTDRPGLLRIEMIVCDVRLAELAGLDVLIRSAGATNGPAIVLVDDRTCPQLVQQASQIRGFTIVTDIYGHAEQAKIFRLLVQRREQLAQST